jgi:hypothetical protein
MNKIEQVQAEMKWVAFFKKYPLFRNQANRSILQDYLNKNMLSVASEPGFEALELAFAACRPSLAENPEPPIEVTPPPTAVEIPKDEKPSFDWSKDQLRAYLKKENVQKAAPNFGPLPADITRERIIKMSYRELQQLISNTRGGRATIVARLDGKS